MTPRNLRGLSRSNKNRREARSGGTPMAEGRASRWSKTLGVILIVVGVVAMIAPFFAAQTMIRLMGWLLILAAIEQGVQAYQSRGEGGLFLKVFLAVLYAFVAFLLLGR